MAHSINNPVPSPFVESSLNIDEALDLLRHFAMNHGQSSLDLVEFISVVASDLTRRVSLEPTLDNDWKLRMESSASTLALLETIIVQSNPPSMVIRALITFIALSYAIERTPTYEYFYRMSQSLLDSRVTPFVLSEHYKRVVGLFASNLFLFWLSYDQLESRPESRLIMKSLLAEATLAQVGVRTLQVTWMKTIMQHKYDPLIYTEYFSDRLMVKRLDPSSDGTTEIFHTSIITLETAQREGSLE